MRRQISFIVLSAIVSRCGGTSTSPQTAPVPASRYVAPSDQTLVADVDPSFDGQSIYILNTSSAPVVITSVHVYDCQNVSTPCTLIRLQVPIGPGQRKRIFVVRPADSDRGYSYMYRWTWSVGGR